MRCSYSSFACFHKSNKDTASWAQNVLYNSGIISYASKVVDFLRYGLLSIDSYDSTALVLRQTVKYAGVESVERTEFDTYAENINKGVP